ncbi:MAG: aminoglycoside phosphotransferase family protein [Acidimicrobiales bacterium]
MKMHEGEVDIDAELVERLIAAQFPEMADLPITEVRSTGTVNAIYRLGDHLCARLPRLAEWAGSLQHELTWLPKLTPHLSLRIPEPVATGHPTSRYPFTWAIYRWIDGQPYQDDLVHDERQAADHLAQFVAELRRVDPAGAPRGGRRPLSQLDAMTRMAIESSSDVIDSDAATAVWERALRAPAWNGAPVWIHTDLLRPNLLVDNGRLWAVIDFGGVGVGDPAADLIAAWSVFNRTGRETYRNALAVDDDTWNRARGYALAQAAMIIPYYGETNPTFVMLATRTVEEILVDIDA